MPSNILVIKFIDSEARRDAYTPQAFCLSIPNDTIKFIHAIEASKTVYCLLLSGYFWHSRQ